MAKPVGSVEPVSFEKHLLVDAANVIHAWPELRVLLKRDRDAARSQLIQRAGAVHDAESVRVTVVIDGRGPEIVVEHPSRQATLTVIYTPSSMTADDVIEKMVGRSADPSLCEVATGDQAERNTIEATGAVWVPPADLLARIERAERRLGAKVSELNRASAQEWRRRPSS
ncbi:MAG: NYN domain-containing protein [Akkermansiaceae bacterium]|nr:NYN domain-containing protein [Verrucomicrobiales bacterium]